MFIERNKILVMLKIGDILLQAQEQLLPVVVTFLSLEEKQTLYS